MQRELKKISVATVTDGASAILGRHSSLLIKQTMLRVESMTKISMRRWLNNYVVSEDMKVIQSYQVLECQNL